MPLKGLIMLFGSQEKFAIECSTIKMIGTFFYGKLRIWFNSKIIGLFTEEVITLASTTGSLKDSLESMVPETSEEIITMQEEALLQTVWKTIYVVEDEEKKPFDLNEFTKMRKYVWIDSCEGFENVRSIRVSLQDSQKIIWKIDDEGVVNSAIIPNNEYCFVLTSFLEWLEKQTT
jgi:hypothetical protein